MLVNRDGEGLGCLGIAMGQRELGAGLVLSPTLAHKQYESGEVAGRSVGHRG